MKSKYPEVIPAQGSFHHTGGEVNGSVITAFGHAVSRAPHTGERGARLFLTRPERSAGYFLRLLRVHWAAPDDIACKGNGGKRFIKTHPTIRQG